MDALLTGCDEQAAMLSAALWTLPCDNQLRAASVTASKEPRPSVQLPAKNSSLTSAVSTWKGPIPVKPSGETWLTP